MAAVTASLPRFVLIAISARETALNSRMFPGFCNADATRLLSRSGDSTAQISTAVSRRIRTSIAPLEHGVDLLLTHRLPPIRIDHPNPALKCSQHALLAGWFLGAHNIHHRHAAAADSDRLALLRRLNQLGQLILGIRYADLHK